MCERDSFSFFFVLLTAEERIINATHDRFTTLGAASVLPRRETAKTATAIDSSSEIVGSNRRADGGEREDRPPTRQSGALPGVREHYPGCLKPTEHSVHHVMVEREPVVVRVPERDGKLEA